MYLDRLRTSEPSPALSRNDIAVRPHDIDAFPIRLLRDPAALGNVVVAGQPVLKYMRGGALYLAQDEDFLCLLRDEELIAISDEDILRYTRPPLHDTIDIDDQSADRPQLPELRHQLLPNGQRLCAAGGAASTTWQR